MGKKNQDTINENFKPKKKQNLKMHDFIKNKLNGNAKFMFLDCGNYMRFITTKNKEQKKLVHAYFCKNRFCPMCTWRKARKDAMKISIMLEAIRLEKKKEFLFLTLTTPNIPADKVQAEITRFNKAFSKLFRRKKIVGAIKGYIRKLEMTYNKERDDYNPHFHVLLCVDKSYFTNPRQYIKHEEWLDMWRDVTGLPEITQVNIKKVNQTRGSEVLEVAKYSAKDYEMTENQEVFDVFYKALKGRQLIVYGGLLKEYADKYENGELDKYKSKDKNEYYYKLIATWNHDMAKYDQVFAKLEAEEKEEYNGHLVDEMEVE